MARFLVALLALLTGSPILAWRTLRGQRDEEDGAPPDDGRR